MSTPANAWTRRESKAAKKLKRSFDRLCYNHPRICLDNTDVYGACQVFFQYLDACAEALQVPMADRAYRLNFSETYQSLFPQTLRYYRVDVYQASWKDFHTIYVNGQRFSFSESVVRKAIAFERSMAGLTMSLYYWEGTTLPSARESLRQKLTVLDMRWASFEQAYIMELMDIEVQARRPIVALIEAEQKLRAAEHRTDSDSAVLLCVQRDFCEALRDLNGMASLRKAKTYFDVGLLQSIAEVQRQEGVAASPEEKMISYFTADLRSLRDYLDESDSWLTDTDPHVANNPGLVELLGRVEDKWEIGEAYFKPSFVRSAISGLVAQISEAISEGCIVPRFHQMLEEMDAEVFLVLPRLVLLSFLRKPLQVRPFLELLLPHRFAMPATRLQSKAFGKQSSPRTCLHLDLGTLDLGTLVSEYQALCDSLRDSPDMTEPETVVMLRAVDFQSRDGSSALVDAFLLSLESWSIELQRSHAEEWNQCSGLLLHCLT